MTLPPAALVGHGLAARVVDDGGERVLWIHGYTLDSSIWEELWGYLPGWRHVGLDLPGHGSSGPLQLGERLPELARRVGAVAAEHDVRHVIGLSWGGMIALQVAIECPETVATLTLGSPAVGGGPQDTHARTRNLELARLYRTRGAGPWMSELWMRSPPDIFKGAATHPELWLRLRALIDRHSWSELGDSRMSDLTTHPQRTEALARIRAATLVIVGEEDMPAFKRCAELLRRTIPRCQRVYCTGAGHLCLLEAAAAVSPLLKAHLRTGARPSAQR